VIEYTPAQVEFRLVFSAQGNYFFALSDGSDSIRRQAMSISMVYRVSIAVQTILVFACALISTAQAKTVKIGVVVDGPWERNAEILELFQTEIRALLESDYTVEFPASAILTADWSPTRVRAHLDALYSDQDIDVVIAMGVMASHDASHRGPLPKPTVAPFIVDAGLQEIPFRAGTSGINNLSYITWPDRIARDLEIFHEIAPYKHLALMATRVIEDMAPGITARSQGYGSNLGARVTVILVDTSIAAALSAIPDDADAVYIAPLLRLPEGSVEALARGFIARRLPSYSMLGEGEVDAGIMASLGQQSNFDRIARRTGLHIQRILSGENASELPTLLNRDEQLTINMATVRAIGVWPPWHLLTEAVLVHDVRASAERHLTLESAIDSALANNADLAAAEFELLSGGQDVVRARAVLLPQIDASVLGTIIDEDRAAASLGSAAERELSGSVDGTQLIFSEVAWANLSIQKRLQEARVAERDRVRLDIVESTASAYLALLRARTLERIEKDNLRRTRSHLQLARVRLSVGTAGQSEVYRWESELATGQKRVIDANARRNLAEMSLNRLLQRPLESSFTIAETDLQNPLLPTSDPRFARYLSNPGVFRQFRQLVSEDAMQHSPELRQLDANVSAQRRALTSSKRAFISPTIGLSGNLTRLFNESGAGADFSSPFPEFGAPADNTDWSIGLKATLPLFDGGSRVADMRQARESLRRLEMERRSLAEQVEQRVRGALHQFGASYAGIRLSQEAADAAGKNLELASEAYSRGAVSILDLLDAQNAALVSDQGAADAVYDCLSDWIDVERASGRMSFPNGNQNTSDLIDSIEKRLLDAGATP